MVLEPYLHDSQNNSKLQVENTTVCYSVQYGQYFHSKQKLKQNI